jgi:predicted PurR-regulated permease PerM
MCYNYINNLKEIFMKEDKPNYKIQKLWAIPLFIAIVSAIIVSNLAGGYIGNIVVGLFSGLTPILFAIIIAFLLKRLMNLIENKWLKNAFINNPKEKSYKRAISLTISFLTFIAIIVVIIATIFPRIVEIVSELINNKDSYIYKITTELTDLANNLVQMDTSGSIQSLINSLVNSITSTFNDFLPKILQFSTKTITYVGYFLIANIIAFLYLKDKEKISNYWHNVSLAYFGEERTNKANRIMEKSGNIMFNYFIANIITAFIILIMVGFTFAILNVKYPFELAFTMSILNFIPYVGFILAVIPVMLICIIFGSVELALKAAIYSLLLVLFITTFISPFIVGKRMQTNVLLLIVSVLVGGAMFGMLGMLFAQPVATIINVILQDKIKQKTDEYKTGKIKTPIALTPVLFPISEDKDNDLGPLIFEVKNEKTENLKNDKSLKDNYWRKDEKDEQGEKDSIVSKIKNDDIDEFLSNKEIKEDKDEKTSLNLKNKPKKSKKSLSNKNSTKNNDDNSIFKLIDNKDKKDSKDIKRKK